MGGTLNIISGGMSIPFFVPEATDKFEFSLSPGREETIDLEVRTATIFGCQASFSRLNTSEDIALSKMLTAKHTSFSWKLTSQVPFWS